MPMALDSKSNASTSSATLTRMINKLELNKKIFKKLIFEKYVFKNSKAISK